MDIRLIKKSEKLILKKIKQIEEENLSIDDFESQEATVEEKPVVNLVETREPNYIPVRDNPVVLSIANSGWQVSEILRDIRVDNFYD
ncbi:hypothetical protein BCD64_03295 [Nostoc sp. MBR 210]|uniref:Uncharacterized protein n=1 Tax=Nostoc spongiaeforme FACHB-130 TaxID=1357510 RepID=A0ABR8FX72_9NOSO|nr:hypothetical protein [Nostoc spongiaeforme]MBD2595764.1 hypothetical protein [Nostoc spongiaeforme FACHB-130]OCQ96377.1 hypothetical protein BCD64_03295 [Nostoc sp. MBR 210]